MPRRRASKFRPLPGFLCVMPCSLFRMLQKGRARPQPARYSLDYSVGTALRTLLGLFLPALKEEPNERQEIKYLQGVRFAKVKENVVVCVYSHHYCRGNNTWDPRVALARSQHHSNEPEYEQGRKQPFWPIS